MTENGAGRDAAPGPGGVRENRYAGFSLGNWLALLLIIFFLGPMLLSNLWGYLQSRRYLTEAAFRNLRNVAALEASETHEFVRAARDLVPSIIAGNQHLFAVLEAFEAAAGEAERRPLRRNLEAHLVAKAAEGAAVREFWVLSPRGALLGSSKGAHADGNDVSSRRCFETGREAPAIVGFEYPAGGHAHGPAAGAHHHGEPEMLIAAPVPGSDGHLLGVFCARFSFDIHRSLLLAHRDRTSQAMIYLLDDRGRIVCGSFDDLASAPFGSRLAPSSRPRFPRPEPWEGRYPIGSGDEALAAYAPIPGLGWGVVVEVPVVRALADLERLKWQAMAGSAALAFLLASAAVLTWQMFVRPLRALSSASDRIAAGAAGETVTPEGPQELSELAAAFNRMSLALRESHDTLESRIAERTRELRESQGFSELLLDSIDQRVIVLDRECVIIKANRAAVRMHGHALIGRTCCEAFEGLAEISETCPARRTFETGRSVTAERSQRTLDGIEPVYVSTYPVRDRDGTVASVVEVARVVTAEKRLQMQMVYQEKLAAFGQLAAGVAHEIGNPLAAIQSQLRLARGDPGRAEKTLDIVRKQVDRMDRMLRRLVGFTRRKRDEAALASANQAVDDVAQLLEHDPRARSVRIESRHADGIPGVRAKEDELVQVLLNLGLNALDAMEGAGTLSFETDVDGDEVLVRVRDTGSGVPDGLRARVFEPFFTTKGPEKGTGLGLFVSKAIVEGMGGVLELEKSSDEGAVFCVRLPRARGGEVR